LDVNITNTLSPQQAVFLQNEAKNGCSCGGLRYAAEPIKKTQFSSSNSRCESDGVVQLISGSTFKCYVLQYNNVTSLPPQRSLSCSHHTALTWTFPNTCGNNKQF
ncbi:Hypothetical predicted protein, partial [Scomber scombrus]